MIDCTEALMVIVLAEYFFTLFIMYYPIAFSRKLSHSLPSLLAAQTVRALVRQWQRGLRSCEAALCTPGRSRRGSA